MEFSKNDTVNTYDNLWDTAKAVLGVDLLS